VLKTFNYASNPPIIIEVSSTRFEDWKELLKTKVTPQTQMVCCLIQGNRGNGALYKPLKNFFLTERPIPSQIMLSGTINKRKILLHFYFVYFIFTFILFLIYQIIKLN
jgi:hypothetical protein